MGEGRRGKEGRRGDLGEGRRGLWKETGREREGWGESERGGRSSRIHNQSNVEMYSSSPRPTGNWSDNIAHAVIQAGGDASALFPAISQEASWRGQPPPSMPPPPPRGMGNQGVSEVVSLLTERQAADAADGLFACLEGFGEGSVPPAERSVSLSQTDITHP